MSNLELARTTIADVDATPRERRLARAFIDAQRKLMEQRRELAWSESARGVTYQLRDFAGNFDRVGIPFYVEVDGQCGLRPQVCPVLL